jgi:hypothetical protein
MGYATVMNVPRIYNYADALKKYDNTKPIKGRQDDPRPLGERRYVDTYSIRKNVWTEAIECILYKTPVIKFTTEGEIIINIDNWPSSSTCQFISRVVPSVVANRVRGQVVLHFADNSKAMLPAQGELILVRESNGRWFPKMKQVLYDYRVSRKEANNVRKQVSIFRDYLSGVVKLKAEEVTTNFGARYETRFTVVRTTYGELIDVFGKEGETHDDPRVRPDVQGWDKLIDKPHTFLAGDTKVEAWANYREKADRFFDLVRNDQDDNARHQNYWIAFNVLALQGQSLYWRDNLDHPVTLGVEQFEKYLDKILMTMFADKVFTKVALPEGKVPTGKYDKYVMTEEETK